MLSIKEITKMYKGTKITSRVDLYKTTKSRSKSSQQQKFRGPVLRNFTTCEICTNHKKRVKKQSTIEVQGSSVAKFRNLRKFTGCENSQPAKFAGCEIRNLRNLQVAKFATCEICRLRNSQPAKFAGCEFS